MTSIPALSSSKEKTNYARLSRLNVDGGAQALRHTFDKFYPPANLHKDLANPTVLNKLSLLKKNNTINPTQWGLLYPASPSSVTSAKFDITLLCILLRNICPLTPPVSGWNFMPAKGDVTTGADVVRVRLYRNELHHLPNTSITDADYERYWHEISEPLVRLGGKDFKDEIEKLKCETMDPESEDHYIRLLDGWYVYGASIKRKFLEVCEQINNKSQPETKSFCHEGTQTEDAEPHQVTSQGNGDPLVAVQHLANLYKERAHWIQPLNYSSAIQVELKQIYTNLRMINREKRSSQLSDEIIDMYNIFKPTVYCSNVRKVLIEGSPGVGKTMYCRKIAYDWANNNLSNHPTFPNFKRVIFLSCCDFESGDNVESVIERKLLLHMNDAAKASFLQQVQEDQEGTLIILDGLDEVSKNQMVPITRIMKGEILSKCFLVVTARHEVGVKVRTCFDTLLEITGYTLSDVQEYIKKYFPKMPNKGSNLIKEILDNAELSDIARNPMNTFLLCALFDDLKGRLPRTRTKLFSMITKSLLEQHASRESVSENPADITSTDKDALTELGKIAFKALQVERSDFDEAEIPKHVAHVGFLSTDIGPSKMYPRLRYRFTHKSFQEYLAAFYLTDKLNSHEEDFEETLRLICSQVEQLWQVIIFTAGMLGDDAALPYVETLMKFVRPPVNGKRHSKFCVILECLAEIENGNKVAAGVTSLLPTKLNLGHCLISDRRFAQLKGLSHLIASMAPDSSSSLKVLNLSSNRLSGNDFALLSWSLQSNITIEGLDLTGNTLGDDDLCSTAQILEKNTSLQYLILRENRIDIKGFWTLINALQLNSTLTKLFLCGNFISSEIVERPPLWEINKGYFTNSSFKMPNISFFNVDELNCFPHLKHLHLSCCCLNSSDETVVQIVRFNTSLESLNLSGNPFLFNGDYEPLLSALQENNTLKQLNLYDTGCPQRISEQDKRIRVRQCNL